MHFAISASHSELGQLQLFFHAFDSHMDFSFIFNGGYFSVRVLMSFRNEGEPQCVQDPFIPVVDN